jgi:hypothetical protein
MLFDKFVNSLLCNIKEESFARSIPTVATRQNVKQIPQEAIRDLNQLKERIFRLLPLSISMQNATHETESWSTRLFRGHKSINPFSKLGDSKAEGDKVFWSKNANVALLYATNKSSWGTSGQQYTNIAQQSVSGASDTTQTKYSLGYMSVAQPKHPENLKWYRNFGYEDEKRDYRNDVNKARENLTKTNPNKLFTGLPSNYKSINKYGYKKDEWEQEQQRQSNLIQNNQSNNKPNVLGNSPETVLSKYDVSKIRTFLVYNDSHMLSLEKIKKYDPILYKVLFWDRL